METANEINASQSGVLALGICLFNRGACPKGTGAAVRLILAWIRPDRVQTREALVTTEAAGAVASKGVHAMHRGDSETS